MTSAGTALSRTKLGALVLALSGLTVAASCGDGGWSSSDKDRLRSEWCVAVLKVGAHSRQCDCAIEVVTEYFGSWTEMAKSTAAPPGFASRVQACG